MWKIKGAVTHVAARVAEAEETQLRGTAIEVGPQQLPRVHSVAQRCAETLRCDVPAIYVTSETGTSARAVGVTKRPVLALPGWIAAEMDDDALAFVIGRELGRLARDPMGYIRIADLVERQVWWFKGWWRPGVVGAVRAWHRNAEYAADRAGLACAGSVEAATRALLIMASGSMRLYQEMDVEAYVSQLGDGRGTKARLMALTLKMPNLSTRLAALRGGVPSHGVREPGVREAVAAATGPTAHATKATATAPRPKATPTTKSRVTAKKPKKKATPKKAADKAKAAKAPAEKKKRKSRP